MDRTPSGWGEPRRIEGPVNGQATDWHPSVDSEGTLYFASDRTGGRRANDIYRARLHGGGYPSIEPVPINTALAEMHPSNRPDGAGADDLYVTAFRNGEWTPPKPLRELNTQYYEYSAKVSPDGKYLFYCHGFGNVPAHDRPLSYRDLARLFRSPSNGFSKIYQIEMRALDLP